MLCDRDWCRVRVTLLVLSTVVLVFAPAWAQLQYKSLYSFKGGNDGAAPLAGVIFDGAGNLFGTTQYGGAHGQGTVYELTPNSDGTWKERVLHAFTGGTDGVIPRAGVVLDAAGNLYGATQYGGNTGCLSHLGCGLIFKLIPNKDGSWTEQVLLRFTGGKDGAQPVSDLIFDQAGNLYGTTFAGGNTNCSSGCGVVFKLVPNTDGTWKEEVLYQFTGLTDGSEPFAALVFDRAGNLYSTAQLGSRYGEGTVYQLTPNAHGSWKVKVLHSFTGGRDGGGPGDRLILDGEGNLYGMTANGGATDWGTVFELTPNSDGTWKEKILYQFSGGNDGGTPFGGLLFDQAGNLFGTASNGGFHARNCGNYGCGNAFKLTRGSNGVWKETVLHLFKDRPGAHPGATLIFDAMGNLYSTTIGGDNNEVTFGSVFEITP